MGGPQGIRDLRFPVPPDRKNEWYFGTGKCEPGNLIDHIALGKLAAGARLHLARELHAGVKDDERGSDGLHGVLQVAFPHRWIVVFAVNGDVTVRQSHEVMHVDGHQQVTEQAERFRGNNFVRAKHRLQRVRQTHVGLLAGEIGA